jgi:hypothetical protein
VYSRSCFLKVPLGHISDFSKPTSENHLPPTQTLQTARETLLEVFRKSFEEAARARDSNATSRFFKLFPAVGWEAEGLEAYASFVVELIRVKAPTSVKSKISFPRIVLQSNSSQIISVVPSVLRYGADIFIRGHCHDRGSASASCGEILWPRKNEERGCTLARGMRQSN